ncbi:hypothetical protein IQ235_16305 [Oscillatoriales cyanobacterium LEGE 11467]|uniref:Uncharacterized protein n=1 Tax=Zarconia navalis LEGE 11467 TaxID=1828826 RepID=A0A928VYA3_9CYAN|nr:DUF5691 domain-containing protein [Zarconia navalis]MBE9042336.1 hypothetical protein [Zarconia navalis LEGE 11467]
MNAWHDIVKMASIGLDRQSLVLPETEGTADRLLSQLDTADPERSLLGAAAILGLQQQAGRVPTVEKGDRLSLSPPDRLPFCSPCAAQHLQRMLAGEFSAVLPQWLEAIAKAKQRVPPEYLPQLLEWGRQHPEFRAVLFPVLGKRGCWLAAQNPDWDYVRDFDIEAGTEVEVWQTGTIGMRQQVLQRLRATDPSLARNWLESIWKQDKAPDRAKFLATFEIGLSLADEALLELALADKSKLIRAVAVDLLARLPNSQFCDRWRDRLQKYVKISCNPSLKLEVKLPKTCPKEATRDGIVPQPPAGIEAKPWWLLQMVAAVPLDFWTQYASPAAFVEMLQEYEHEYEKAFLEGWAIAAARHGDIEWGEALLDVLPSLKGYAIGGENSIEVLMQVLPTETLEMAIVEILEYDRDRLSKNHPAICLLRWCRYPWSLRLSRAVLDRFSREIATSKDTYNWGLRSAFLDFVYSIDPMMVSEVVEQLQNAAKAGSYWAQTVDEFLEILQFRFDFYRAIDNFER